MKLFKVNDRVSVACESVGTRYGFRHDARLIVDGGEVDKAKVCYHNRTWESFQFESVLQELLGKTDVVSEQEKKDFFARRGVEEKEKVDGMFKSVAMVSMLGDVLCDDVKKSNDWKERMLNAGLGNLGLEMPEDWDRLDEDTKKARLDAVIAHLQGGE